MTAKDSVRALLDRLPDDCTLDEVQYHLYVVQAVARGEANEEAGRVIPHEPRNGGQLIDTLGTREGRPRDR